MAGKISSGANRKSRRRGGKRRGVSCASRRIRRVAGWIGRLVAVAVMVPIILVPLYTAVPPVSTLMAWQFAGGNPVDRRWVPLEAMAPSLVASVLMSEDGRFCSHHGVDWGELNAVLEQGSDRPRGASTITMQTVKNLFLWQSRSVVRKALEIPLAMFADTVWGKRRTMEIYLNIVEWGPGIFGAEAATQHHFGRSADRVTASQSALLAVTLPNPAKRDPAAPLAGLRSRASTIAARARASGAYSDCLAPSGSL